MSSDVLRSISGFFGLTDDLPVVAVDGTSTTNSGCSDLEHISPITSLVVAESDPAGVPTRTLRSALGDADCDLAIALQQADSIEDEWSGKQGAAMQQNSSLRIEARQAEKRAKTAESALRAAQERVATLEKALTDAALASSDQLLDAEVALDLNIDGERDVASLGEGHGGVDLGGARASRLSANMGPSPTPSSNRQSPATVPDSSPPAPTTEPATISSATDEPQKVAPPFISPAKLTLEDASDNDSAEVQSPQPRTSKGACRCVLL